MAPHRRWPEIGLCRADGWILDGRATLRGWTATRGPDPPQGVGIGSSHGTVENFLSSNGSRMRILIDGVFFQLAQSGIARVWKSLIPILKLSLLHI